MNFVIFFDVLFDIIINLSRLKKNHNKQTERSNRERSEKSDTERLPNKQTNKMIENDIEAEDEVGS